MKDQENVNIIINYLNEMLNNSKYQEDKKLINELLEKLRLIFLFSFIKLLFEIYCISKNYKITIMLNSILIS